MKALHATHCRLEPQLAAHAPEMFRVLGDPALYEFEHAAPESEAWLAARFARLESRRSRDGSEHWLNWVIRLPTDELVGYVQATVKDSGVAFVAYEVASAHWRRGIGSSAVRAMLQELSGHYGVHTFVAVLKQANHRSRALLLHLGFQVASDAQRAAADAQADELVMCRPASLTQNGR